MRTILICVFFALIVQKELSYADQDNDFKPTPIPLNNWKGENLITAAIPQEIVKTNSRPTAAAIPPHYWEHALRHSVYLTLVRDKIDRLIAEDLIASPDRKPDGGVPKEVDDHDLWEQIKAAPFDRIKEEPFPPSDTIVLARGKLVEERGGYRFVEGDLASDRHKDNRTQTVKAYWSVKRARQGEIYPGKYHYELTFSVTSQSAKSLKKQRQNPVRTFTIRENAPIERSPPKSHRNQGDQHGRAQRAVWVHKNIGPNPNYHKRPGSSRGFEGYFSSLFSDEDNNDDNPNRLTKNAYIPQAYQPNQHAKISRYMNEREPYHQKKVYTYPLKFPPFRYSRPPLQPPPTSIMPLPYFEMSQDKSHILNENQAKSRTNPKTSKPLKNTIQAILPTPVSNNQFWKEFTVEESLKTTPDVTDYTTKTPEISSTTYRVYPHKKASTRVNYLPENIRTPVYNAPPGVFVTMDKKPFKPLPPLKPLFPKPLKTQLVDFKPSPQILDSSYTNVDSTADTAFRPMKPNSAERLRNKNEFKNHVKPITGKKPPKKHDIVKSNRLTTLSPDVITIHGYSEEEDADLQWAEILAAFTRTTPMESQNEKEIFIENDFTSTTSPTQTTVTKQRENKITTSVKTTTTTAPTTKLTTSTTAKPTTSTTAKPTISTSAKPKRTRPPPKFKKPEKIKKHKRITSTTSTTTTSTTFKPLRVYPTKKTLFDLTPQASSVATNHSVREFKPKENQMSNNLNTTATTSTSTTTTPTTSQTLTTTTMSTTTTARTATATKNSGIAMVTTPPKIKNRFRQSVLLQKGTSVNSNKGLVNGEKNSTSNPLPLRRKASKFQGYIPASTIRTPEKERHRENHIDHVFNYKMESISSSSQPISSSTQPNEDIEIKQISSSTPSTSTPSTQSTAKKSDTRPGWLHDMEDIIDNDTEKQELSTVNDNKDNIEFIFPIFTDENNKIKIDTKTQDSKANQTVMSQLRVENNKSKCKNKKQHILTTSNVVNASSEVETTTSSIHTSYTTVADISDLFDDFLGGFTMDDDTGEPKATKSTTDDHESIESETTIHEKVIQIGDDVENFLHSLDQNSEKKVNEEYEEENEQEDIDQSDIEDRDTEEDEDYYDVSGPQTEESQERPFSLLELMSME